MQEADDLTADVRGDVQAVHWTEYLTTYRRSRLLQLQAVHWTEYLTTDRRGSPPSPLCKVDPSTKQHNSGNDIQSFRNRKAKSGNSETDVFPGSRQVLVNIALGAHGEGGC